MHPNKIIPKDYAKITSKVGVLVKARAYTGNDSADYRTDLAEILEFEKYHTLEAENGLAGLQKIRHILPDLIICDVDMPVMNGMDVLKTVKADPIYAKIPFVVSTGRTDTLTMQTLLNLGADTYLTKPISISEFLITIGTFCGESTPDHRKIMLQNYE